MLSALVQFPRIGAYDNVLEYEKEHTPLRTYDQFYEFGLAPSRARIGVEVSR
jgi:hypothetical protein